MELGLPIDHEHVDHGPIVMLGQLLGQRPDDGIVQLWRSQLSEIQPEQVLNSAASRDNKVNGLTPRSELRL